jgi:hypothetical protein
VCAPPGGQPQAPWGQARHGRAGASAQPKPGGTATVRPARKDLIPEVAGACVPETRARKRGRMPQGAQRERCPASSWRECIRDGVGRPPSGSIAGITGQDATGLARDGPSSRGRQRGVPCRGPHRAPRTRWRGAQPCRRRSRHLRRVIVPLGSLLLDHARAEQREHAGMRGWVREGGLRARAWSRAGIVRVPSCVNATASTAPLRMIFKCTLWSNTRQQLCANPELCGSAYLSRMD